MGKFFVFSAAVEAGETALVVAGLVTSAIAAFFYLKLIVTMWLQEPAGPQTRLGLSPALGLGLSLTAAGTIAFGVWPQALMELARRASVFVG
jgi:NADH-quinone oxidoreductase subunit N